MAATPGIIQAGSKELLAAQDIAGQQMTEQENYSQIMHVIGLGANQNNTDEESLGLRTNGISAGYAVSKDTAYAENNSKPSIVSWIVLAGIVYYFFKHKRSRK